MKHVVNLMQLSGDEIRAILSCAAELKEFWRSGKREPLLQGRVLTQVFEKPSLRTRVSFEAAIGQLGGSSIFLSAQDAGFGGREHLADIARVVGSYSDVIALRTFKQAVIDEFVQHARCSIINALSDDSHPCQALTDLFTIDECCGGLKGRRIAYVGDGNNVAVSLAEICAHLGVTLVIAAPVGYQLPESFLRELNAQFSDADVSQVENPLEAVRGADVVYTDVWASMGQESEKEKRNQVFAPYQVNAKLMKAAGKNAKFMHCLPAKRGLEVTDDVLDSHQSLAFEQAENRMHLAKGLLVWLLKS